MKTSMPLAASPGFAARGISSSASRKQQEASKLRRITMSPSEAGAAAPGFDFGGDSSGGRRPSKVARLTGVSPIHDRFNNNNSMTRAEDNKEAQHRLKALRQKFDERLPLVLSRIRLGGDLDDKTSGTTFHNAVEELGDILKKETASSGTTVSFYHLGGHVDLIRAMKDTLRDNIQLDNEDLLAGMMRILHLLCCRPGYYRVPEVLGVSCMNTSLVYIGAMDVIFQAIERIFIANNTKEDGDSSNSIIIHKKEVLQHAFEITDVLLTGYTFSTMVQLKVPRLALNLLMNCPKEPLVVTAVANFLETLTTECEGAANRASWVEQDDVQQPTSPSLLQSAQTLLIQAQKRFSGSDESSIAVYQVAGKAVSSIRDIVCNSDNSSDDDDDDGGYDDLKENENNKEN